MFDRIKMECLWKDHEKVVWSLQTAKTCPKERWRSLGNYNAIQIRTFTVAKELINAWVAPTLLWVLCSFLWSASSLLNLKIWCLAEDKRYRHTDGNKHQDTCEPVNCSVWGAKSLRSQGKELLKLCPYTATLTPTMGSKKQILWVVLWISIQRIYWSRINVFLRGGMVYIK